MLNKSKSILATGVVAAGYLVSKQTLAESYEPTPYSYAQNLLPLVAASTLGLANYRYSTENSNFCSQERRMLSNGPDHVANVNATLNERGIHISPEEYILIQSQFELDIIPGSSLDRAFEEKISSSFYDSYEQNILKGEVLNDIGSKEQLEQFRVESTNNKLGWLLHSGFNRLKSNSFLISENIATDNDQVLFEHMQYQKEKITSTNQIDRALLETSSHSDAVQRCNFFKERLQELRNNDSTPEEKSEDTFSPSI